MVQSTPRGRRRSLGTPAPLAWGSPWRAANRRASPPAQLGSPGFPPSLPQSTRPSGSIDTATALLQLQPGKYRRHRRRAPAAPRSRPREGMESGAGAGKREASPLHRGCSAFHTPTRLRPYCLADSQWEHASAADDAEIRHGGAACCPGGGVRRWLHSALCCHAALRWTHQERRSCVLVHGAKVGFTWRGAGLSPLLR